MWFKIKKGHISFNCIGIKLFRNTFFLEIYNVSSSAKSEFSNSYFKKLC